MPKKVEFLGKILQIRCWLFRKNKVQYRMTEYANMQQSNWIGGYDEETGFRSVGGSRGAVVRFDDDGLWEVGMNKHNAVL